jgi:hypothetical protein
VNTTRLDSLPELTLMMYFCGACTLAHITRTGALALHNITLLHVLQPLQLCNTEPAEV